MEEVEVAEPVAPQLNGFHKEEEEEVVVAREVVEQARLQPAVIAPPIAPQEPALPAMPPVLEPSFNFLEDTVDCRLICRRKAAQQGLRSWS